MESRKRAKLEYVTGDATEPQGSGPRILVHVCNDVGGWGRGFVVALSRRWKGPEARYRAWARGEEALPFELGQVQFVRVEPELWVANLIGQRDVRARGGQPPIRYEALRTGLEHVSARARELGATVQMPRIGAGLAGGKWDEIERIVRETLMEAGVPVTVYDLPR